MVAAPVLQPAAGRADSHRFAMAAMADLIIYLHEGRILEAGSHARLLASGGPYAELFRLEAAAYQ